MGQTELFNPGMATDLENENSKFKPVNLDKIDLVLHPVHVEALVNTRPHEKIVTV